ncbi:GIY-YIG nuclease family protein [Dongshaea marina]|uniref:GIY-YIG nuclease family protein n=1 Tax=Dongshaea marina TaxID=2047966 RepID=UPI0018FFC835|nr:GIY-YIG nuclease family protein [Dongshaea marina]
MLNKITQIGFRKVGEWYLDNQKPQLNIHEEAESSNILYSFVVDGIPKYIGKTTQPLKKRMYGYLNPGATQSTNIRNHQNILDALTTNSSIELYVLPDHGLLHFGEFHLNLAAGLEDSLIAKLSPAWNGGEPTETIKIQLGDTYYNKGFFNIPVAYQEQFGADGEEIEIYLGYSKTRVKGYINRTANTNETPRIMGGKEMTSWLNNHFEQGDVIYIAIKSSHAILIRNNSSQLQPA